MDMNKKYEIMNELYRAFEYTDCGNCDICPLYVGKVEKSKWRCLFNLVNEKLDEVV